MSSENDEADNYMHELDLLIPSRISYFTRSVYIEKSIPITDVDLVSMIVL